MPTLADVHKARFVGDGEELVVLGHGFGTDQTVWHNLEPLLLRRQYRVLVYNIMGHGTGVPTGFSSTSLGHSANSRTSGIDSGRASDPAKSGRRRLNSVERATSDVANEEFQQELQRMKLEGELQGAHVVPVEDKEQVKDAKKKKGFGGKVGESFRGFFGRNKRRNKADSAKVEDEQPPIAAQNGGVPEPSNDPPQKKDPEFSGRRTFNIEDLDKSEESEKPERIEEEETGGIVSEEDFNYSRYTTLDAFAEDLINLLDELGVKNCSYVGHSVSGMIGVIASVKRPDLFKKLVLLAASPRYMDDVDYVGGFKSEDVDGLLLAIKTNYKQWVQGFAPAAIHTPDNEAVADYAAGLLDVRPDVAYCILSTIFRSDYRHLLPQVTVPCHILLSQDDVAVPPAVGEYLHKHLRGSVLETLATHGHLPHLSSPMIVNAALIKHLELAS